MTAMATEALLIEGSKVAGWHRLFVERPDLIHRYDQIALLDDDLICSAYDINAAFDAGRDYHLSLWQPSLSWDSYFSYAALLHNPLFLIRYINFIEMMCPFFSSDHLKLCLRLFDLGYETGIDRLWCRLREDWHYAYAVIDSVQFRHSRPVGKNRESQGFTGQNSEYQTVIDRLEAEVGVYFRGPVAYGGITRNGKAIMGRRPMAMRSIAPLCGWRVTENRGWFYRPIIDHFRHILTRPINNEMVSFVTNKN